MRQLRFAPEGRGPGLLAGPRPLAVLLAVLACCASPPTQPAPDAGTPPPAPDSGCTGCFAVVDAGFCESSGGACGPAVPCCPGLGCDAGFCAAPLNPCQNGEQPLPTGCGCDPTLSGANGGCAPGFFCGANLRCDSLTDAGVPPLLVAQGLGDACDPAAVFPDGGAAPPCAQRAGGSSIDCVPDPSGLQLYVCAQACAKDQDCPLAWQSCGSAYAAPGHCGDTPCTAFPASPTEEQSDYFHACVLPGGESGLCTPFATALLEPAGQIADYGLCVQTQGGIPEGAACVSPPQRVDGGLCDGTQLCVLGACRATCNVYGGGCRTTQLCWPFVEPKVPGALYLAGGCVDPCEPDGGCDAGQTPPAGGGLSDGGDGG